jgi:hypothetical protein
MGKSKHSKEGNPNSGAPQNPKHNPNPNTTLKSVKDGSTNPKVTPQVQVGTGQKSKTVTSTPTSTSTTPTSTYPLTQKPHFIKPEIPGLNLKPQHQQWKPFVIPKGGDKRARDPSLNSQQSEGSGRSLVPPPAKKPYAEVVKHNTNTLDMQWPDLQLRIYGTKLNHEHMSFQAFNDLKAKLARYSFKFLQSNPGQCSKTFSDGIYYNKVLKCRVILCNNSEALDWYKEAIDQVGDHTFRGWAKEEQVTTCIKFFVPLGLDSISSREYLEALRIMYDSTRGIPWTMLKEYIHHSKHTRIIIATIPADIFTLIQTKGTETSAGSGVWKAIGFMGPLKLMVASENDLRTNNNNNNTNSNTPKNSNKPPKTQKPQKLQNTTPTSSPNTTSTAPEPESETSLEVEDSPEKPLLLNTNPLLSETAGSMSPLHVAMNAIAVSNDNENDNEDFEESENTLEEEDMDFGLLTSPNPTATDTDEYSGSWAEQC